MSSEYERKRLEQIRANEEFLASLDVDAERQRLEKRKRKESVKAPRQRKKKVTPVEATRKSSRLQGKEAESLYILSTNKGKVTVGGQPPTMRKGETDGQVVTTYDLKSGREVRQRSRFEDQVLDLGLEEDDMQQSGQAFFETLLKEKSTAPTKTTLDYSASLAKLECKLAMKLTPNRAYSVGFHSSVPLACIGDRDGYLGMLKLGLDPTEEDILQYRPHVSTINAIEFLDSKLYSISYDGTVRSMDMNRPNVFDLVYSTEGTKSDVWLQHGVIDQSNKSFILGSSDGVVVQASLDPSTSRKHLWRFQAHEKKVQTVSLSKSGPYMATASLDRTVKLWDLRKLPGKGKGGGAVASFEDSHSISCCFFNPSGSQMVAVGMSNKLHLFADPHQSSKDLTPSHSITHDNRTGRYLAVFHASWDPKNDKSFIVGSMLQPRRVEVFSTESNKMRLIMNLSGDLVTSVQSRNAFHPNDNMVACANASGRIHIFR